MVGQDGLGPAALRGGLDAGLEVGAVVTHQGGAGGVLEGLGAVLVIAHEVDGGLRALKEVFAAGDVSREGLSAFGIVTPDRNMTIQAPVFCMDRKKEGW